MNEREVVLGLFGIAEWKDKHHQPKQNQSMQISDHYKENFLSNRTALKQN